MVPNTHLYTTWTKNPTEHTCTVYVPRCPELRFQLGWALTRDINCIHLYGSCYNNHMKFGTWALPQEWVLAQDTTVYTLCM